MTALAKFSPWLARPLDEAAKSAKFRTTLDQHADRVIYGHSALKAGWIIGATGVAMLGLSVFGWVTILRIPPAPPLYNVVDRTTGYIGPATRVDGAPALFGEANDHFYLQRYIIARESWVPEDDQSNDYLVKIMSCHDEQARYAAWRKLPTSPMTAIGKTGHVRPHNFTWHELPMGSRDTKRYLVHFDLTTYVAGTILTKGWSTTADFQWHPELPMRPYDRDQNAGGFQVCAYDAEPDSTEQKK